MEFVLLVLSILLSTGRNLMSKKISFTTFGQRNFFLMQFVVFITGIFIVTFKGGAGLFDVAPETVLYSLIYSFFLLCANWCYTVALVNGNTSICVTIYSMGFIIPTLSGMLFWNEKVSAMKILGIICVIPAVIMSGIKSGDNKARYGNGYFIPAVIAMLTSGGLGIMQKIQQKSPYPEQFGTFVLISFIIGSAVSLLCAIFAKKDEVKLTTSNSGVACTLGFCWSLCNLLNTFLSGALPTAVFFPMLNIGMILLSTAIAIFAYKEKITRKTISVVGLGILSILLINL